MAYFGRNTVLGAGADVVIGQTLTDRHDNIVGMVRSDQAGTLHVEQSADGTNWDLDKSTPVVANTTLTFSEALIAPYVRVRYVNGGTQQGYFRISAKFSSAGDS